MSNKQSFSKENFIGDPIDRDLYTTSQMRERALNAAILRADIAQSSLNSGAKVASRMFTRSSGSKSGWSQGA